VEKIQLPDKTVNNGEGSFNNVLISIFNVIQKQIAETVLVFNDFKVLKWTRCIVNSIYVYISLPNSASTNLKVVIWGTRAHIQRAR
jgi:hypothetical protein